MSVLNRGKGSEKPILYYTQLHRSVISLGLSTFRLLPGKEEGKEWSYSVTTYNITLLCQVLSAIEFLLLCP